MDGPLIDPAAVGPWRVTTRHTDLHDTRRARTLPIKLYLPDTPAPSGLILFSHGLGGSREGGSAWLGHWASHGYLLLAMQHPGSDCSILRNNSPQSLRSAFKAAMNPEELTHRVDDFRFVLERIGRDASLPDAVNAASAIGLAGHSFGAVTVQLLAGERRAGHPAARPDPRLCAVLALSPSARQPDAPPGLGQRFAHLRLPFMGITGSRDDGMGLSDISAANRELPYRHAPAGLAGPDKYLLVFGGGNHLDFAGQASQVEAGMFAVRREPAAFQGHQGDARSGMNYWSIWSGVSVAAAEAASQAAAEVRISWAALGGNTLAETQAHFGATSLDYVTITFDAGRAWDAAGFLDIMQHEFGHALGLVDMYHDSTNSVIGRYYMVQFTYNLRRFGKKGSKNIKDYDGVAQPSGSRRMGPGGPGGPPPGMFHGPR